MLKQHVGIETKCCYKINPIERRLEERWNRWSNNKSEENLKKFITTYCKSIFKTLYSLLFKVKRTHLIMISKVNHRLQQSST